MQDGKVKVIEYAYGTLNKVERSYCATRREMLALIFGLKHFRSNLIGRCFVCRVDHFLSFSFSFGVAENAEAGMTVHSHSVGLIHEWPIARIPICVCYF